MPVIAVEKTLPVSPMDEPLVNLSIDGHWFSYRWFDVIRLIQGLRTEIERATDADYQIPIEGTGFWIGPEGARRLVERLHNQLQKP